MLSRLAGKRSSDHRPTLSLGRVFRPAALARSPFRIDQRTQIIEAIRRDQSDRHQLPQRRLQSQPSAFACRARYPRKTTRHAASKIAKRPEPPRSTRCAPQPPTPRRAYAIHSASSRTKNVIGATLLGVTFRPRSAESTSIAGCGENLPQPTAPPKHNWSKFFGSYSNHAAAPGSSAPMYSPEPHTPATAANPPAFHARPQVVCPRATCCHRNSHRMNCAACHWLNLLAQPSQRQTMNARQQPPPAPFRFLDRTCP